MGQLLRERFNWNPVNCAQFSLLLRPSTWVTGWRVHRTGNVPQCPKHTLHTGWWCLQHHRSCRAWGGGVNTHKDVHSGYQTKNTPEHTQLYTENPEVPSPTLSLVLPSPRQEELYCFERATLGAAPPGTHTPPLPPPRFWHFCKTYCSSESRHLPPRLLQLGVGDGGRTSSSILPLALPKPLPNPLQPEATPLPKCTRTKLSYPGIQGNKEIVWAGSGGSGVGEGLEAEPPPWCGDKTGTTATLVQLEGVLSVRGDGGVSP